MSDNGFDRAPERYIRTGRETIDRQRDRAHMFADWFASEHGGDIDAAVLADFMFAFHCDACAIKYEDRGGAKGDSDGDAEKVRWYRQMQYHVAGECPDPRSARPDFVPYQRKLER